MKLAYCTEGHTLMVDRSDQVIAQSERGSWIIVEPPCPRCPVCASGLTVYRMKSVVYFMRRACGAIKIGVTTDLTSRKSAIAKVWGPVEVLAVIPGDREVERELHRTFESEKLGNEWFRPSERLRALIEQMTVNHGTP